MTIMFFRSCQCYSKHTNKNIIDYVISNNEVLPKEMIDRYQKMVQNKLY